MTGAVLVISDGGSGWYCYLEDQPWIKNSKKVVFSLTLKFDGRSPVPDNYSQLLVKASCYCSITHRVRPFATPFTEHTCLPVTSLSVTVSQSLLKLLSIESMMPSTISSSATPFSSCPQSFPASGSFPMS